MLMEQRKKNEQRNETENDESKIFLKMCKFDIMERLYWISIFFYLFI